MDFTVSEKMKTILGMIDEFVDKELIPLEPEFLTKPARSLLPVFEEKRKMVKQMELWAPNHPKEYGGMELNLMEHALVSEVIGSQPPGALSSSAVRRRMPATSKSCINSAATHKKRNI